MCNLKPLLTMKKFTTLAVLLFAIIATAFGQTVTEGKKVYTANHINPTPPVIDGVLNDKIWQKGDWESGFMQHEPYNGAQPTQPTEFKIYYDNDNIYAAFRML